MIEKLKEYAEKYSERTAYISGKEKLSFGELFERAQKIAEKMGGKKTPVVVYGSRNADMMAAITACILEKRAYVPIDASIPKERKKRIITASKAGFIIDCTGDEPIFSSIENDCLKNEENKTAYVIFTSGSTGTPKGVPISYENLDNFINWITGTKPLCDFEHANVLNQAAFSFDLSTAAIFYSLFGGHALVQVEDKNDFGGIFDIISNNKTDVLVVTPTFIRLCLLNRDFNKKGFPFIKCIYFCGETLQKSLCKELFKRFPDIKIINAYGPTEATSAVSAIEITEEMLEHEKYLPVGNIFSSATEIEIKNEEIVLKGKSVFSGYLGEEGKDRSVFGYRTGDLGYISDGKLYCKGRLDTQIKYKGYRIELSEIESDIEKISGVENCAVVAKRNEDGEVKMIKAFFSGTADEEKIRKELFKELPDYMVPKIIKKLEKLPLNKNGKTDRKELEKI